LAGLAGVKKTLIERMEAGAIPPRIKQSSLDHSLLQIVAIVTDLLDFELFPWLAAKQSPGTARQTIRGKSSFNFLPSALHCQ